MAALDLGSRSAVGRPRGISCLNNRYHDPALGSFLSVDPLVHETGDPYIYGAANPITYSDPDGLDPDTSAWIRGEAEARGGCTYSSGRQCFIDRGSGQPDDGIASVLDWYNPGLGQWSRASAGYGLVPGYGDDHRDNESTAAAVAEWAGWIAGGAAAVSLPCWGGAVLGNPKALVCAGVSAGVESGASTVEVAALWIDGDPSAKCKTALKVVGGLLPGPAVSDRAAFDVAEGVFGVTRQVTSLAASAGC